MTYGEFLSTYAPRFWSGVQVSMLLFVASAFLATCLGSALAALRLSGRTWLSAPATVYTEFFRGTSLVVQIYWIFFVLPLFGLTLEPLTAGILAISMNAAAYGGEIIRGAVLAVPRSQWEAALVLGMSPLLRIRRIIAPQAIAILLPAWGNFMIDVLKATSLVALISVVDIMFVAKQINGQTFLSVQAFGTALVAYYIFARFLITPGMRALERVYSTQMGAPRV